MTCLLMGYNVLKSTGILSAVSNVGETTIRYRLAFNDREYIVHSEHRYPNGVSSEAVLYKGDNLNSANYTYSFYSKEVK